MPSAIPTIPGEVMPPEDSQELRTAVADLLERDKLSFPGAQPVSFARHHINELQRAEYFMCEKTDGIRVLLFLYFYEATPGQFEPATFLIDRKNIYRNVTPPLRIPHHLYMNDRSKFLFGTILDGELVLDVIKGVTHLRYYVFDCLALDGQNMTTRPLDKRIAHMQSKLFKPYGVWKQHYPDLVASAPFEVKEKQLFSPYHLEHMFKNILPNLPHGNDGLVFTCKGTPYVYGTDKHILKWKPPHENTIDFKLKLGQFPKYDPQDGEGEIEDYDAMPDNFFLEVNVNHGQYERFSHNLQVNPEEWEMLKSLRQRLDGRIIECYRDYEGRWRFKKDEDGTPRWRDDKQDANHISTVRSVLETIEDGVTQQHLLAAQDAIHAAVGRMRKDEEQVAKKRKFSEVNGAH